MSIALDAEKDSVSSVQRGALADIATNEKCARQEPADRFYIVHILFLLLGLMHSISYSFFVTANAYWMYKFRNVTAETADTGSRTTLQTHFSSGCSFISSFTTLIFILSSTYFGYKIKARRRLLASLMSITLCFAMTTAFVKINTSSWQTGFFALAMGAVTVINSSNSVLAVAALVILSKFPPYYLKIYLVGQGSGGIFNASLQILSLALGTSTTASALMYFSLGWWFMGATLVLYYISNYNALFNYYAKNVVEDIKRAPMPVSEMKMLLNRIWPCVGTYAFFCLTRLHSPISALVVSENYGNGNPWNDTYFVPTITFLYSDVSDLMGRLLCFKIKKTVNGVHLMIFLFIRMLIFVPLIFFCNAQPRHHIPLLLPHDYQYILVLGMFSFTNGYLVNLMYLDTARLAPPGKVEGAFMVMTSCTSIMGVVSSPLTLLSVDML